MKIKIDDGTCNKIKNELQDKKTASLVKNHWLQPKNWIENYKIIVAYRIKTIITI